jgi:hypothetical protein
MRKLIPLATALALVPMAALALPQVGDILGTNPTDATAALEKAGCTVQKFESEDGKIEAKCLDAEKRRWEIYIDPRTGAVTRVKQDD